MTEQELQILKDRYPRTSTCTSDGLPNIFIHLLGEIVFQLNVLNEQLSSFMLQNTLQKSFSATFPPIYGGGTQQ